jgi:hypothetical protein
VLDAQTETLLPEIVRRQSHSLLVYVSESFPWTTPQEQSALGTLRELALEERKAVADLARFLQRRHVSVPYVGSYPSSFTTINYASLDYVLPLLVKSERDALSALERDASQLSDADARALIDRLIEIRRRHLKTLEGLAATAKPAMAMH